MSFEFLKFGNPLKPSCDFGLHLHEREDLKRGITRADESLSVDTQGDICDQDGTSDSSETGAPAVVDQQSASTFSRSEPNLKGTLGIDDGLPRNRQGKTYMT